MSEGEPEVCSAAGSSLAAGAASSLVCSVISWSSRSVDAIAQFRKSWSGYATIDLAMVQSAASTCGRKLTLPAYSARLQPQ